MLENHVLFVSFFLFLIGFVGLAFRRGHVIINLLCLELILLAAILNFVAGSAVHTDLTGAGLVLFVIAISASEIGLALALIISFYKKFSSVNIQDLK